MKTKTPSSSPPALPAAHRVRDVAARLQVDAGRVLQWIHSGRLKAIDVSEGSGKRHRWRITPEALAEFEAARAAVPAPSRSRRTKSGWQYRYF